MKMWSQKDKVFHDVMYKTWWGGGEPKLNNY